MAIINLKDSKTVGLAYNYLSRKIALTQLHPQSKRPIRKEWQENIVTDPNNANLFHNRNIGFILGDKSQNLIDVDLDCPEALALAKYILPPTPWVFGRKSKPRSHYLYVVKKLKTQKFQIGSSGVLLEIRSSGAQTMAPGSTHPDGETVRWESREWDENEPSSVERDTLIRACQELAAASLVLRHGWVSGKRDDVAVALCGLLLRADWDPTEVDVWLEALAKASGDEELDMRLKAEYQMQRLADDSRVPGIPRLIELMGKEVTEKVIEWLGLTSNNLIERMNDYACIINDGGKVRIFKKRTAQLMDIPSAQIDMAIFKVKSRSNGEVKEKRAFPTWVESAQAERYDGFIFEPNGDAVQEGYLNTWRGFPVDHHGDKTLSELREQFPYFLNHLYEFVCQENEQHFKYLLDWLSHLVQCPEDVPGVALVLRGEKGSGKTILAYYIKAMLGHRYSTIVTNSKHVFGKFNAVLRNKLFVCLDDIHWSGMHDEESILKNMITGEELTLERKFADVEEVRSYMRVMIATNSAWAAPVGRMDRRFFVLDLPAWLAPKNPSITDAQRRIAQEHFHGLRKELRGDGPSFLFSYLSRRKIKAKSFINTLPITAGYLECQQLSVLHQNPLQSWVQDCIASNTWGTEVPTDRMYNHYVSSLGSARKRLSKVWFSRELINLIPMIKVVIRRKIRMYLLPPRAELITFFLHEHNIDLS